MHVEREKLVLDNCLAVRDAVEAWAADNQGAYPNNLGSENLLGESVIDYLPGAILLENPFTGLRTEPVSGAAATLGSTGFTSGDYAPHGGLVDHYLIDGVASYYEPPAFQREYTVPIGY